MKNKRFKYKKPYFDYEQIYFAHPIAHYNTEFEWECIDLIINALTPIGEDITDGGINIFNPNQKWLSKLYQKRKNKDGFEIFREIVRCCDSIVGVTFMDGILGAGVAEELDTALAAEIPAYLIFVDNGKKYFMPVSDLKNYKILSIEETRKRIDNGVM